MCTKEFELIEYLEGRHEAYLMDVHEEYPMRFQEPCLMDQYLVGVYGENIMDDLEQYLILSWSISYERHKEFLVHEDFLR